MDNQPVSLPPERRRSVFWKWANENFGRLRLYARKFRPGSSEDLVQEFYLRAHRQPSGVLNGLRRYTAFAIVVIKRLAWNRGRDNKKHRHVQLPEQFVGKVETSMTALSLSKDLLERAILLLTPGEIAWVSAIRNGANSEQLGQQFGCKAAAARQRKLTILKRLRVRVELLRHSAERGHESGSVQEQILAMHYLDRLSPEQIVSQKGLSDELVGNVLSDFNHPQIQG